MKLIFNDYSVTYWCVLSETISATVNSLYKYFCMVSAATLAVFLLLPGYPTATMTHWCTSLSPCLTTKCRSLIDRGSDGLRWPALSRHEMSCARCGPYLLSMTGLIHCQYIIKIGLQLHTSRWCFSLRTFFDNTGINLLPSIAHISC